MTELRQKIQNKLRRKYKYSTNTNYGRGVVLVKPPRTESEDYINIVCDYFTPSYLPDIHIYNGDDYIGGLMWEELDLIHTALMEFRGEIDHKRPPAT